MVAKKLVSFSLPQANPVMTGLKRPVCRPTA